MLTSLNKQSGIRDDFLEDPLLGYGLITPLIIQV